MYFKWKKENFRAEMYLFQDFDFFFGISQVNLLIVMLLQFYDAIPPLSEFYVLFIFILQENLWIEDNEMMDFHPFLLGYWISWEFFTFSFLIRAGNLSILFIRTWDDIRSRFYGLFEGDFAGGWWKVFDQISRIFKCSTKTNLFYLKI